MPNIKRIKVFHFFHSSLEHHNQPMMKLFHGQACDEFEHIIVSTDPHNRIVEKSGYQYVIRSLAEYISFTRATVGHQDVIVIHGLYSNWHYLIPLIRASIAQKVVWDVWGDDYFSVHRLLPSGRISDKLRYCIRRFTVPKFGMIAGFNQDVQSVVDTFGFKKQTFSLNHPLRPNIDNLKPKCQTNLENDSLKILVGNSGSRSNEHIRALELLRQNKEFDGFKLYCIFSTDTEPQYTEEFNQYIKNHKIENITIITQMMDFDQFINFIDEIDVFVLPHRRQQGVGTSNLSLILGKTVFIDFTVATAQYYLENGIKVFDVNMLGQLNTLSFDLNDGNENSQKIKELFGIDSVKEQWSTLLQEFACE